MIFTFSRYNQIFTYWFDASTFQFDVNSVSEIQCQKSLPKISIHIEYSASYQTWCISKSIEWNVNTFRMNIDSKCINFKNWYQISIFILPIEYVWIRTSFPSNVYWAICNTELNVDLITIDNYSTFSSRVLSMPDSADETDCNWNWWHCYSDTFADRFFSSVTASMDRSLSRCRCPWRVWSRMMRRQWHARCPRFSLSLVPFTRVLSFN